jgi:hypothetical protein
MEDKTRWRIYQAVAVCVILAIASFAMSRKEEGSTDTSTGVFHFVSDASKDGILWESGSMKTSKSPDWWVNSGALLRIDGQEFSTNLGSLSKDDKMRKLYKKNNPKDTDDGYHPQNIFRLVNRHRWQDFSQEVYFSVDAINLSESDNRAESNGVLLFNRYQDGDNLYYTGIRVDGFAVIKKKIAGKYYTLKQKHVLTGEAEYDRDKSPNLIPTHRFLGIKSEVVNDGDGVDIRLYMDSGEGKGWQLMLETHDTGDEYGEKPFLEDGYAGIRTDFMDVIFRDYSIREIGG